VGAISVLRRITAAGTSANNKRQFVRSAKIGVIAAGIGALAGVCAAVGVLWWHGAWSEFIHPHRLSARVGQIVGASGGLIALIGGAVAWWRKAN
jgi:hypothetical protein